ncbi:MAG TPA: protein phosphatase CheZ [Castellaniella sp.]|uniref:protein phosphatase CheZ n=1 Tax=Castellaniella sp. TaxID=1955812 RepID=UPI002EDC3EDF
MDTNKLPGAVVDAASSAELLHRIAQLTRTLHESMRELGLEQAVKEAAHAIPDARDRLHYVAQMTEQAANRVLNAAEQIQPWQDDMQRQAKALDARWQQWFDHPVELDQAKALVGDTRVFLKDVPEKTQASQNNLMDIIMAQDFQDLTGQVIMKMLGVIGTIETELVQVLVDNAVPEKREESSGLLNGPAINAEGKSDVMVNQDQVDDLLSSLGF